MLFEGFREVEIKLKMVSEEHFILKFERERLDQENKERAKFGLPLKPIPECLMTEYELELALEERFIKDRDRKKGLFPTSEEDIIYDSKGRDVYDQDGISTNYD